MKELVYDSLISDDFIKITFYKPLTFNYDRNFNSSGTHFLEFEELDIYGIGSNLKQCEKDLADDFIFLWRNYVMEDEKALSICAQELKKKILQTFRIELIK